MSMPTMGSGGLQKRKCASAAHDCLKAFLFFCISFFPTATFAYVIHVPGATTDGEYISSNLGPDLFDDSQGLNFEAAGDALGWIGFSNGMTPTQAFAQLDANAFPYYGSGICAAEGYNGSCSSMEFWGGPPSAIHSHPAADVTCVAASQNHDVYLFFFRGPVTLNYAGYPYNFSSPPTDGYLIVFHYDSSCKVVLSPYNQLPKSFYSRIQNTSSGSATLYAGASTGAAAVASFPDNTLMHITRSTDSSGAFVIANGFRWYQVTDPAGSVSGWMEGTNASDTVEYLPYNYMDQPATAACSHNCFSNVLFLPGIEASRLYDTDSSGHEQKLWEPPNDATAATLTMTSGGQSTDPSIYTRDVIDNAYVPSKGNIYQSFIADMNQLKSNGTINDWLPAAYDWRLTLDQILSSGAQTGSGVSYLTATDTPYIIQELKRLAATSKSGKVTIIAHSNGGLVAKALMQKIGDAETAKLIDKVILVASPQVGTPQAIAGLLHGYDQALPFSWNSYALTPAEARSVGDTMPGLYTLLPSARYFTYIDDPAITFATSSILTWASKYGPVIHSQSGLQAFLSDAAGRTQPAVSDLSSPTFLNSAFISGAQTAHDTLDSWTPPPGVQVVQIAGWGMPTTVSGIDYVGTLKNGQFSIEPSPRFTIDGDGTVVVPSTLWMSTTTGAVDYWLDLKGYNRDNWVTTLNGFAPFQHLNIMETQPVRTFLLDTLEQKVKPIADYVYISQTSPLDTTKRLHYALHSPLTLDLYDNQENHTGISTSTGQIEDNVPGSYYSEFAGVKYLFTDASTSAHIVMSGYATGTFTFNVDEYQGNSHITGTTFQDIPTTPSTIVTLNAQSDISTLSPLVADENGDGKSDISLAPKLGGVVTVDTMPPSTSASTTGTLGTNGWYIGNVLATFSATDTESGVHSTYYTIDNSATSTGTSTLVNTEGIHTLRYYSDDNAGNVEASHVVAIKIDKTAPEAAISADTAAGDLSIAGIDNLSSTTVLKGATTTAITDAAGHTTTLSFQKTYAGKLLTYAKLAGVSYDKGTAVPLPSSFLYVWDAKQILVSQTVVADNQFIVEALYDRAKNKTTIIVLKRNIPIQTQVMSGLVLIKLSTYKGAINYGW